jgi:hypothetical protein
MVQRNIFIYAARPCTAQLIGCNIPDAPLNRDFLFGFLPTTGVGVYCVYIPVP